MDLTNHSPRFGRRLVPGIHLVEISDFEYTAAGSESPKGDKYRITFRAVKGMHEGCTVSSTLYDINSNFKGTKGHRSATLDNWFHLLVALGIKPGKFDPSKMVPKMMGKQLGVEVIESDPTPEGKTYANVQSFMKPEVVGALSEDTDMDDLPSDDLSDEAPEMADIS